MARRHVEASDVRWNELALSLGLVLTLATTGCGAAPSPEATAPTSTVPPDQPGQTQGPEGPVAAAQPTLWTKYSPKDGSFAADFPGKPEEVVEPTDGPNGKVEMHQFAVERPTGSAFMASYTDFPAPPASVDELKQRLVGVRDVALKSAQATLVEDKEILVNGIPGREYAATMMIPEAVTTHTRIFMKGGRLFQFMTLVPKELGEEADVRRFLDSIALAP